jgi:ABC-type glycerol-3-phosphate transport system substrate-binding protein
MKKRLGIIALCLVIVASMFAGCKKTTPTVSVDPNAPVTIKLGMWPESTDAANVKMFQGFQATMKTKYPNVTVTPDNYKYAVDTFASMAEAGTAPTIFETWYTEPQKLINSGYVADITSELKAKGWDKDMNPSILALMSKGNKIYGLPRDGYSLGLYLNLDMFSKAGLVAADGTVDYPKTWDAVAQDAVKIKTATGKAGFCLLAKDAAGGWHYSNIAWNFGASLEKQDSTGKWLANLSSTQDIAAMQFVSDLKWKYNVLTADPTTEDWGTGFKQLGTGNAAMVIGANDAVAQPTQINGLATKSLAIVPMPAGPSGSQYSLLGGTPYMFASNATPGQITASLNFLEIMGKAPLATTDAINGMKSTADTNQKAGVPVIPDFPAWINPQDYLTAKQAVVDQYSNVDFAHDYQAYYDFMKGGSKNLKEEEPQDTQKLYGELTKVLQAVVTDQNADIKGLLATANTNTQTDLDTDVNDQ